MKVYRFKCNYQETAKQINKAFHFHFQKAPPCIFEECMQGKAESNVFLFLSFFFLFCLTLMVLMMQEYVLVFVCLYTFVHTFVQQICGCVNEEINVCP